jgi:hypothetical protein
LPAMTELAQETVVAGDYRQSRSTAERQSYAG